MKSRDYIVMTSEEFDSLFDSYLKFGLKYGYKLSDDESKLDKSLLFEEVLKKPLINEIRKTKSEKFVLSEEYELIKDQNSLGLPKALLDIVFDDLLHREEYSGESKIVEYAEYKKNKCIVLKYQTGSVTERRYRSCPVKCWCTSDWKIFFDTEEVRLQNVKHLSFSKQRVDERRIARYFDEVESLPILENLFIKYGYKRYADFYSFMMEERKLKSINYNPIYGYRASILDVITNTRYLISVAMLYRPDEKDRKDKVYYIRVPSKYNESEYDYWKLIVPVNDNDDEVDF